jgi:hypothetical protein
MASMAKDGGFSHTTGGNARWRETGMFRHGTAEKRSKDPTRRGSRTTVSRHVLLEVSSLIDRIMA